MTFVKHPDPILKQRKVVHADYDRIWSLRAPKGFRLCVHYHGDRFLEFTVEATVATKRSWNEYEGEHQAKVDERGEFV